MPSPASRSTRAFPSSRCFVATASATSATSCAWDCNDAVDVTDDEVTGSHLHAADHGLHVDVRHNRAPERVEWRQSAGERGEAESRDLSCVTHEPVDDDAGGSAADRGTREELAPRGGPDTRLDREHRHVTGAQAVERRQLAVVRQLGLGGVGDDHDRHSDADEPGLRPERADRRVEDPVARSHPVEHIGDDGGRDADECRRHLRR